MSTTPTPTEAPGPTDPSPVTPTPNSPRPTTEEDTIPISFNGWQPQPIPLSPELDSSIVSACLATSVPDGYYFLDLQRPYELLASPDRNYSLTHLELSGFYNLNGNKVPDSPGFTALFSGRAMQALEWAPIFETIYHAAVEASTELSEIHGPYSSYEGSPSSKGQLQYDLWGVTPTDLWDWDELKAKVKKHGLRNSLLVAPMPTASTSQILGFNECFEPYTSNIYSRRVLAGEFQIVNPWLLKDLVDMGLWSDNMKNRIIANNGSIQAVPNIPDDIKALYKTVWEISQKKILEMAADRGAFIDQSQSLNIHIQNPTMGKLTSMHFYGWKLGLKTGMYYLRTQAAAAAIQFTVDQEALKVEDTNVARVLPGKKRIPNTGYTPQAAMPRPMMATKPAPRVVSVGGPPPPAPRSENSEKSEPSPTLLATEPLTDPTTIDGLEELENKRGQAEDAKSLSDEREVDIYADAVLACSIENKEECMMCSA